MASARPPPLADGDVSTSSQQQSKDLAQLLYQLIEEATDLAALKTQKGAAERDFTRREKEFIASKPNHEKFPATEVALRESKLRAKKALYEISQKCEKKDATLKSIALQGATQLVSIAGSKSTQAQDEKTQGHIDSLQKRCQDLEDQLREQKLFIEKQRSAREETETSMRKMQQELASTSSKVIADDTMIIRDHGLRLQKLDDRNTALTGHMKTIVETQSKFREVLETVQCSTAELKESITAVESRVDTLASRLDYLPSNGVLANFKKRISAVESENLSLKSVQSTATNTPAPEIDTESVKKEILEIVQSREDAFDSLVGEELDRINKAITRIEEDIEKQTSSDATPSAQGALSKLQSKVEEMSKSIQNQQTLGEVLRKIDGKFNQWTIDQHSRQRILSDRLERIAESHQDLDGRVEGATTGINHINARLNRMNTREMAVHILSQMDSTYPNLRDAQTTLLEHTAQLLEQSKTINGLTAQIGQAKPNAAGEGLDPETAQALRKDLKELSTHMTSQVQKLAKNAEDAIDAATKRSAQEAQVLADQLADVHVQLGKLEDQQKALSKTHRLHPANSVLSGSSASGTTPAVETRERSIANGNGNGIPLPGRNTKRHSSEVQHIAASTSRQSSGEPQHQLPKKRRPNEAGRFGGTAAPMLPRPFPPEPKGVNSRPGRKKRKLYLEGDDEDDYDFEPPQPTIDDNEDD